VAIDLSYNLISEAGLATLVEWLKRRDISEKINDVDARY
jgi:hypothetical protein